MGPDDPVCLCFRVSRRKLLAYLRVHRPRVASELSQCGGAGTGCGWCVPTLRKLFAERAEADDVSADEYARRRASFLRTGVRGQGSGVRDETAEDCGPSSDP